MQNVLCRACAHTHTCIHNICGLYISEQIKSVVDVFSFCQYWHKHPCVYTILLVKQHITKRGVLLSASFYYAVFQIVIYATWQLHLRVYKSNANKLTRHLANLLYFPQQTVNKLTWNLAGNLIISIKVVILIDLNLSFNCCNFYLITF